MENELPKGINDSAVMNMLSKQVSGLLNSMAFQNADESAIRAAIMQLFEQAKEKGLISEASIQHISKGQDTNADRIQVNVNIQPFFPSRHFTLKLSGTSGEESDNMST